MEGGGTGEEGEGEVDKETGRQGVEGGRDGRENGDKRQIDFPRYLSSSSPPTFPCPTLSALLYLYRRDSICGTSTLFRDLASLQSVQYIVSNFGAH